MEQISQIFNLSLAENCLKKSIFEGKDKKENKTPQLWSNYSLWPSNRATNPEAVLKRPQFGVGQRKRGIPTRFISHSARHHRFFFSFRIGNTKEYSQSKEGKVGLAKVGVVSKQ